MLLGPHQIDNVQELKWDMGDWDPILVRLIRDQVWTRLMAPSILHFVSMAVKAEIFRRLGHPESEAQTSLLMRVQGTSPSA